MMNDNIDGEPFGVMLFKPEDEEFWKFMESSFNDVTRLEVRTETIEQMFDRCVRISHILPKSREQLWIECAAKLTKTCRRVLKFAKNIYMTTLDYDDQIILLQQGTFELVAIRMSRYIEPSTKCLLLDETILPERAFYTTEMDEVDVVSCIFNFAKDIADLKLTDAELAIFSAIVLYNNVPPVIFRNEVERRKRFMMRALKAKLDHSDRQPLENGVTVYDALIAKIPELRRIKIMFVTAVARFEREHPYIMFPQLHQDLFSWGRLLLRAIAA